MKHESILVPALMLAFAGTGRAAVIDVSPSDSDEVNIGKIEGAADRFEPTSDAYDGQDIPGEVFHDVLDGPGPGDAAEEEPENGNGGGGCGCSTAG